MIYLLSRFVKPILMALIVFVSVHYLLGSYSGALALAAVPLLLGWLNIGTDLAAALTVIALFCGAAWYAMPISARDQVTTLVSHTATTVQPAGDKSEVRIPGSDKVAAADATAD